MSDPTVATARVLIRADGSSFSSDVEKGTASGISSLKKSLAQLGIGAGLAISLKAVFDQFSQGQQVAAQTATRIKDAGDAAFISADQVHAMAVSLQNLSGVNQNVIQSGENLLLTFHEITNQAGAGNDVFNRATKAALDLSTAGFGPLSTTARTLGKALQDPTTGLTALRRVGVTFNQTQIDTIKNLEKSGDLLDAQKLILDGVESKVKGAAAAYGDTLSGQLNKAKNSALEFGAGLLSDVVPALTAVAGVVGDVASALEQLPNPLKVALVALTAFKIAEATAFGEAAIAGIGNFVKGLAAATVETESLGASLDSLQVISSTQSGRAARRRDHRHLLQGRERDRQGARRPSKARVG